MTEESIPIRTSSGHSSYSVIRDSIYELHHNGLSFSTQQNQNSNSDRAYFVYVQHRNDLDYFNTKDVNSNSPPSESNNHPYHATTSAASFSVKSAESYYSSEEVDVFQQPDKDINYGRDHVELEHHIEEEKHKGDYEGDVRETPKDLGDLLVYYKLVGCLDGSHCLSM